METMVSGSRQTFFTLSRDYSFDRLDGTFTSSEHPFPSVQVESAVIGLTRRSYRWDIDLSVLVVDDRITGQLDVLRAQLRQLRVHLRQGRDAIPKFLRSLEYTA